MALLMPTTRLGTASASATFEQPFDMLAACHDRVRRSLALLTRLVDHLGSVGNDVQAQQAAVDVMRYFDLAAPAHHTDEERHIFPLLDASGDPALRAAATQLRADHAEFNRQWPRLRALLSQIGPDQSPALAPLQTHAAHFAELHDRHLALEDSLAYPQALAALRHSADPLAEQRMGEEMAERRGSTRPPPLRR